MDSNFLPVMAMLVSVLTLLLSVASYRYSARRDTVQDLKDKMKCLEKEINRLQEAHRDCESRCAALINENHELLVRMVRPGKRQGA